MISCFSLFLSVTIVKNFTSCEMEQYHTLPFQFVLGLRIIFMVGGLGVEDQKNSLRVIYFCGVGPREKSNNQNKENGMEQ